MHKDDMLLADADAVAAAAAAIAAKAADLTVTLFYRSLSWFLS